MEAVRSQFATIERRMSRPFAEPSIVKGVQDVYADHATEMLTHHNRGTWPRLSPRYAAYKAKVRPGRPMMVFDGHLSRALTDPGNRRFKADVRNTRMVLWPDIPYAARHQAGKRPMPQRKVIDLRPKDAENVGRAILGGIFKGLRNIT